MKRRVMVYQYKYDKEGILQTTSDGIPIRVEKVAGKFHQFGVDYVELNDGKGIGSYSTAIVEYSNGVVENVSLDLIRFMEVH